MRFETFSYRGAEEILNGKLTTKQEIEEIIKKMKFPEEELTRPRLRKLLSTLFQTHGWEKNHQLFPEGKDPKITIPFLKDRVGLTIAFTHFHFLGMDLLKYQLLSYSNLDIIDVGVHIVATKSFHQDKWEGSQTYERVLEYLPKFRNVIQVPLLVIGLL